MTDKIIDYRIIKGKNIYDLENKVFKQIIDGWHTNSYWQLIGGITIDKTDIGDDKFYQNMVLYIKKQ